MDVKPRPVTKERSFLREHRQFLCLARSRETFIKMVCSKEIDLAEFKELCEMIRRTSARTHLLLQPLSSDAEGHEDPELMRLLGELQSIGLAILEDVRIVPRLHKILGIR